MRKPRFHVLIDTDALVSLMFPKDQHHTAARKTVEQLKKDKQILATTNLVILETASILSQLRDQQPVRLFIATIAAGWIPIIQVEKDLQEAALKMMTNRLIPGPTVTNLTNIVVMKKYLIRKIFCFNQEYASYNLNVIQASTS